MANELEVLKSELEKVNKENAVLRAELAAVKKALAEKTPPPIGSRVVVVGLSSWDGWTGKLVSVDEVSGKAGIEIYREKAKRTETCYTDLHRVRLAPKDPK